MTNAFTVAERQVAEDVSADPLNTANDNDIEAGGYIGPIADAVLRGDLSEKAMASLGRELLQVYQRDVIGLVLSTEREIDEEEAERLARTQRALAEMPAAATFRLH
ncbi:conserved hypothetical protein [Cupriavidus necator]|uniref:Uncharacterized protein n=1 Tax=Cupriavidus necator TaxID=106590 RepID=A0A1K0JK23_CUPNE|nr:conserved hypothetical protein [Cupriavidus necator]